MKLISLRDDQLMEFKTEMQEAFHRGHEDKLGGY